MDAYNDLIHSKLFKILLELLKMDSGTIYNFILKNKYKLMIFYIKFLLISHFKLFNILLNLNEFENRFSNKFELFSFYFSLFS